MSYYPKQYPVLERSTWAIEDAAEFECGTFEHTVLTEHGVQVSPDRLSGFYTTAIIDAGQAVAWKSLAWKADVGLGASIIPRTRFGATEEECASARWSAPYGSSPAKVRLTGSREFYASVVAARFLQVRVEMTAGMGGSPTLQSLALDAGLIPPACVGPINLGIVEDGKPVFYWTRVEGAASYSLELSATSDFARALLEANDIAESSIAYPRQLRPGEYYWRVRAIDGLGRATEFSRARRFTVRDRAAADTSRLRHPYLFFTADDLPHLKDRLKSKRAATWEQILARADEALGGEVADEMGVLLAAGQHGGFHGLAGGTGAGQLEPLAFTYLITGDERYAIKAREVMLRLVGYSRWTGVQFGDANAFYPIWQGTLETAGLCRTVATAYDWLFDYLSEDDRMTVRAGLLRLGVLPLIESWADPKTIRYVPRHQIPSGNWWSVCNSGAGVGALAMINEVPDAARWVAMIADAIRAYLVYDGGDDYNVDVKAGSGGQYIWRTYPNWGQDGGYIESLGYVDYGLTNAMFFIDALKRVMGDDLAPFINRKLIDQAYYFIHHDPQGGCGTVGFNDSGRVNLSDNLYALLTKHLRCERSKYLLKTSYPTPKSIHTAIAEDDSVMAEAPDPDGASKLFRDIGWCVFRSGWGEDASLLAAKFTHGRGHQDIGQFVIHHRGRPFIIDPGVVPYSDPIYRDHLSTSHAHNLVMVDGQCQVRADGTVLGFAGRPGIGIVEADLTAAYQDLVSSWTRTLIYLEPDVLAVIHRIASDSDHTFAWQIHPEGEVTVQPGIGATICREALEMQVRLASPARWRLITKQGYIGSTPAEYLSFETERPCKSAFFVAVSAGTERGRNVGIEQREEDGALAIRVTTPNASHVIIARQDGASDIVGWDVSAAGSICAVTRLKGESRDQIRWTIAGTGPLRVGDRVLAGFDEAEGCRVGAVPNP